jgi:hypothetical protein
MTQSSRFAKEPERWVNELWNVSLFPVATSREEQLTVSGLENIGGGRTNKSGDSLSFQSQSRILRW